MHKFPDPITQLHSIVSQLENSIIVKTRRRYNMIKMILPLKSHLSSHAYYRQLHNMDCISLSHESSLRRLYSRFGLDTEFLTSLKAETGGFNQFERHLCLNMDGTNIKSGISNKG
ncbi:hypothetical protein LOD99_5313 [Oopsacas minuta]|uniref:Uncharacterized protein n=1 Tax=Oopsacas minuta TaxID=111878 RepID=A0AAV7JQT5_9METZ|nr:hypothetical protein LOD99_5313 [Oopsacas minuta]